ncbi:hypothetical protein F5Y16DRAFT_419576 [Xylariaceae sp. FL0255]|nr:hypothetical protein F5Y16DRAFT_419576 [Xylariaceae sp. FL0255]
MPSFLSKLGLKSRKPKPDSLAQQFANGIINSKNETKLQRETKPDPFSNSSTPSRLAACDILKKAGIPFAIWDKDAVRDERGALSPLFALFLVVPDPQVAGQQLRQAGYVSGGGNADLKRTHGWAHNMDDFYIPPRPKVKLEDNRKMDWETMSLLEYPAVALLSSEQEFYPLLDQPLEINAWYAPLSDFLAASMTKYLNANEVLESRRMLAIQRIRDVYGHQEAQKPEFECLLPKKYRALHRELAGEYRSVMGRKRPLFELKFQQQFVEQVRKAEADEANEEPATDRAAA